MTCVHGEYLSEDILDPSFVKCLSPIHILQLILGSTHADIRDGFIMPTTRCQKLYTAVWFVLCTHSIYHFLYFYYTAYYNLNRAVCICLSLGAILQYITYVINVYNTRFASGEKTLNIYLKLQKIDRMLKINEMLLFNREQYRYNLFLVFLLVFVYIPGYMIHIFLCVDGSVKAICFGFGLMIIYLETYLIGNLIYYLGARVKYINGVIKMFIVFKKDKSIKEVGHSWATKDTFDIEAEFKSENSDALDLKKYFECIEAILKTYQDITQHFRVPVFAITLVVYFWSFLIIEASVVGLNSGSLPWVAAATIVVWVVFYYVQLTLLAVTNDWFCGQLRRLRHVCIYALSVYYDGPVFYAARDLIRLVEQERAVFVLFGVCELTRALPLRLLTLITNNVVILLQFTL